MNVPPAGWTRERLRTAILEAAGACGFEMEAGRLMVSRARHGRGEFASNAPLVLTASTGASPREIGARLGECLLETGDWPGPIEEANGFLNFGYDDNYLNTQLARALAEGEHYGSGKSLAGQRINVEFVSADPTGPVPLGGARHAVVGEALCRALEFQGADVTREFYLNDVESSPTMRLLGESVAALYLAAFGRDGESPEGALRDSFVRAVAEDVIAREGNRFLLVPEAERTAAFAHRARDMAVAAQKQSLRDFGAVFDVWTSENALRLEGRVTSVLERLQSRGHAYLRDGALWLRSTEFGDDSDRPLVRANGQPTYLAADIAYHVFKLERGFDLLLNLWSAGHQAYVQRTRAALQAEGYAAEVLEVHVCEGARLASDGTMLRGQGGGELSLGEALQELDRDTLWFALLLPDWAVEADIDVEAARVDDDSNPVYAARLATSRLKTMLGQAEARPQRAEAPWTDEGRALARLVALWPDEAESAALSRKPQKVARFLLELGDSVAKLLAATVPVALADGGMADLLRAARIVAGNASRLCGLGHRENF